MSILAWKSGYSKPSTYAWLADVLNTTDERLRVATYVFAPPVLASLLGITLGGSHLPANPSLKPDKANDDQPLSRDGLID